MLVCAMWVSGCTDDSYGPCGERHSGPTDGECDEGLICHEGVCIDADGEAEVSGMDGTLGAAVYWEQYGGFGTATLVISRYALCDVIYAGIDDDLTVNFTAFTGGPATLIEDEPGQHPDASLLARDGTLPVAASRTEFTLDAGELVAGGVLQGSVNAEFADRTLSGSFSALVCTDNGSR